MKRMILCNLDAICVEGQPNHDLIRILHLLRGDNCGCGEPPNEVYIMANRAETDRAETVLWLEEHVSGGWDYDTQLVVYKPDDPSVLGVLARLGVTSDNLLCVIDAPESEYMFWRIT